jgi:hypothetical protein
MEEQQKNGRTAEERQNNDRRTTERRQKNDHSERVATVYINSSTSPCQILNFSLNSYLLFTNKVGIA